MHPQRFAIAEEVARLDPERDHQRIVFLVGSYDFPFDTQRALEMALFRTFAVPSISRLLQQTGQFVGHGQRRYDDTALLVAEITEHGYDSERGRAAIRRMNQLHRRYEISNDDYLYVLSTFIYEPERWNARFGWRKATHNEKLANYYFWREVGRRMNIRDIPPDNEAFRAWKDEYERQQFRYSPSNQVIGEATVRVFLSWLPALLRPLARESVYAVMDDTLREAFGFPKPHGLIYALIDGAMALRAWVYRNLLPPRTKPFSYTALRHRSYPHGYTLEELGA
jgi:hypothetical protein